MAAGQRRPGRPGRAHRAPSIGGRTEMKSPQTKCGIKRATKCPAARRTYTGHRGYLLIEYLIYIAVLAVVMELAFSAFYRCLDNSRDLARNAEDILRVLRVGELWRSDIREAVAAPAITKEGDLTACEIPKAGSLVVYAFADGGIWR